MSELIGKRIYHPERLSRRGEAIAWISFLLIVVGWAILVLSGQRVIPAVPIMGVFLLFAGLSISLGNWMDRKTEIRMDNDGIAFTNGLRKVYLDWEQIKQVRVILTRWGRKIQVFGEKSFFEFRTLGEVNVGGETKGRMGFVKGDEILEEMIRRSGLQIVDRSTEVYYYARE